MAAGRPQIYSDYKLREVLMKMALENKEKITPSVLEKETGIKRHVWLRRMKKEIDLVNKGVILVRNDTMKDLPLPNIVDIVEKYYDNKENLINELIWYNEKLNDAYTKVTENEALKLKISNIEHDLNIKNLRIKELENKCRYFEGQYLISEAKNNMFNGVSTLESQGKLIELKKEREKIKSFDFKSNFPDLFGTEE